jgi:hypothetical protein
VSSLTQGTRQGVVADPVPALGPGLAAVRDGHWQLITARARCAPGRELGAPGPWRVVDPGRAVAELSPVWLASDDRAGARAALVAWAVATVDGELPSDAPQPPGELVARVTAEQGLGIEASGRVVVAQSRCDGPRVALRAVLGRVEADLPSARGAWLEAVLADARRRWRVVRCGVDAGEVVCEVDLSGAPDFALEDLLRHGMAALRHVSAWLLPGVDLCLDRALPSALLDQLPAGDGSGEPLDPNAPRGETP